MIKSMEVGTQQDIGTSEDDVYDYYKIALEAYNYYYFTLPKISKVMLALLNFIKKVLVLLLQLEQLNGLQLVMQQ